MVHSWEKFISLGETIRADRGPYAFGSPFSSQRAASFTIHNPIDTQPCSWCVSPLGEAVLIDTTARPAARDTGVILVHNHVNRKNGLVPDRVRCSIPRPGKRMVSDIRSLPLGPITC
jgi:hypothetical protein